jgi:hypothetical protein
MSKSNIFPLLHVILSFVGQHHTNWIVYASINNNGYFQGIYASHSQILHLFQFAGEMSNSHMYKFPQNNLYSYYMIADSSRKIHISENEKKNTVQRLIYQGVN